MKIWITTDTHFSHQMLIDKEYRPTDFENLIIQDFANLREEDILIHLGDVCLGNEKANHETIIQPLPCKKILVRGNHDGKSNNWYYNHGWDFVCRQFVDKFFGKRVLFSHIPQADRMGTEINLHGHSHGTAHRDDEFYQFYDNDYHKELALENNDYKLFDLEKLI